MFTLKKTTTAGRLTSLATMHGTIDGPFFMPVGTGGAMRGIGLHDLEELGAQIMLSNTYHLHLAPGEDVIERAGGLHTFIGWNKPMLTDSGGFQVFSLRTISDIGEKGVAFRSHRDGSEHFLGPEEAMRIQHKLGADMIMCFDQCPPSTAARAEQTAAVDRTLRWAKECKRWHSALCAEKGPKVPTVPRGPKSDVLQSTSVPSGSSAPSVPLLFGIVQGGLERDLREKCAQELVAIGFDGYAIGGLAVGESPKEMHEVIDIVCPLLPENAPRYLMGVGRLDQMEKAVAQGIDMFDCVLPMREARHGSIYLTDGSKLRIRKPDFIHDHSPIDPDSRSLLSRRHSKSYLCHLFRTNERSAEHIACMQNMAVTLEFMENLRGRIEKSS